VAERRSNDVIGGCEGRIGTLTDHAAQARQLRLNRTSQGRAVQYTGVGIGIWIRDAGEGLPVFAIDRGAGCSAPHEYMEDEATRCTTTRLCRRRWRPGALNDHWPICRETRRFHSKGTVRRNRPTSDAAPSGQSNHGSSCPSVGCPRAAVGQPRSHAIKSSGSRSTRHASSR
jgi:hypothetical protein